MAAILWSDVTSLPGANVELAGVPVAGQTIILAVANARFDTTMFDGESGPLMKAARCYFAAHMAAMGLLGSGGVLTGEAAGGLSRQYAAPTLGRSELMRTSYGAMVWQLIGSQAHGPRLL